MKNHLTSEILCKIRAHSTIEILWVTLSLFIVAFSFFPQYSNIKFPLYVNLNHSGIVLMFGWILMSLCSIHKLKLRGFTNVTMLILLLITVYCVFAILLKGLCSDFSILRIVCFVISVYLLNAYIGFYEHKSITLVRGYLLLFLVGYVGYCGYYKYYYNFSYNTYEVVLTACLISGFSAGLGNKSLDNNRDIICSIFHWLIVAFSFTIACVLYSRIGIISIIYILVYSLKVKVPKFVLLTMLVGTILFVFAVKTESTKGRIFIAKCSLTLNNNVKEVLFGGGDMKFDREYMQRQGVLLQEEDHDMKFRADDMRSPLNEYINCYISFGILGLSILSSIILFVARNMKRSQCKYQCMFYVLLMFFATTCCLSYPITIFCVALICLETVNNIDFHVRFPSWVLGLIYVATLSYCCYFLYSRNRIYSDWRKAHTLFQLGKERESLELYSSLSTLKNEEIIFNYASVLLASNRAAQAKNILNEMTYDNYQIRMLKGEISMMLKQEADAIEHFSEASMMCPNRFLPLFHKYLIYYNKGDSLQCDLLRNEINNKQIKVHSKILDDILKIINSDETYDKNII